MTREAANPSQACAEVVVDELVRNGVRHAVLAPGSRSTALAFALADRTDLALHVEIDERSAGFLAVGLARRGGMPAAVVVTSGTAVANLHPAVVEADTGDVPLLLLTADRPPELRHTGANQAIDQIGIFASAPRWQVEVGVAEDRATSNALWRSTVSRAVAEARGVASGAGPVHLNLAFREPTVPRSDDGRAPAEAPYAHQLAGRPGGRAWIEVRFASPRLGDAEVDALAERITAHPRGLLVVGATSCPPGPLAAFAEAAGWPVVAETISGARRGPNALAHAPLLLGHASGRVHRPQLVVRIGRTGVSPEVGALLDAGVPQIAVDAAGRVHDPERSVSEVLVADPAWLCSRLAERLRPGASDWLAAWRRADEVAARAVEAVIGGGEAWNEPRLVRDLTAALPDGATLVVGSSMPVRDLDRFAAPRDGLRFVANRGASGIDGFVSTALGAALAADGPVVAVCGDLSLLHDANGFLLDADGALDAVFVVVDNDGGGIFSFLPQAAFPDVFERAFATPHGRSMAHLATLHGLTYAPLETPAGLADALDEALAAGGLHLLHVRTDRAGNRAVHAEVSAAVGAALDAEGFGVR